MFRRIENYKLFSLDTLETFKIYAIENKIERTSSFFLLLRRKRLCRIWDKAPSRYPRWSTVKTEMLPRFNPLNTPPFRVTRVAKSTETTAMIARIFYRRCNASFYPRSILSSRVERLLSDPRRISAFFFSFFLFSLGGGGRYPWNGTRARFELRFF